MLPEEVTKFIGQLESTSVFEVEREVIRRYADPIDDSNPLYWDEEYAKKSKYGSMIAPPGLISSHWFANRPTKWPKRGATTATVRADQTLASPALAEAGFGRIIAGGTESEFFCPVRAGDTITASSIIKDIVERQGSTGNFALVIRETTSTNQNSELVARIRTTLIHR